MVAFRIYRCQLTTSTKFELDSLFSQVVGTKKFKVVQKVIKSLLWVVYKQKLKNNGALPDLYTLPYCIN